MFQRYAVYFAPRPGSPLARLGADWLGRAVDGRDGIVPARPDLPGCRTLSDLTAAPRRYGLHATLKAPIRIGGKASQGDFLQAVAALAERHPPVELGALQITWLGRFLAITPTRQAPALERLAAAVVEELDDFRTPPGETELARRRAGGLTERQEALLARWGYPYVMEEFRFHVTLTGPVEPHERAPVETAAQRHFAPALAAPARIDDLAVFAEDEDGVFHLIKRFELKG